MNYDVRAYNWGVKAAQDDLLITDNPYWTMSHRAAWESGFCVEKQQSHRIDPSAAKSVSWR